MSGPDFAAVLSTTDWSEPGDTRPVRHIDHRFHGGCAVCAVDVPRMSAALHAELARWLGDEGTQWRAARAIHAEFWHVMDHGRVECDDPSGCGATKDDMASVTAALTALTTTDQEDHRR